MQNGHHMPQPGSREFQSEVYGEFSRIHRSIAKVWRAFMLLCAALAVIVLLSCSTPPPPPPNPIERSLTEDETRAAEVTFTRQFYAVNWLQILMDRIRAIKVTATDPIKAMLERRVEAEIIVREMIAAGQVPAEFEFLLLNGVLAEAFLNPTELFPPDPTIEATTIAIGTLQAGLPPAIRDADSNRDDVVTREEYDAWAARTWKALLDRRKTWWTGVK